MDHRLRVCAEQAPPRVAHASDPDQRQHKQGLLQWQRKAPVVQGAREAHRGAERLAACDAAEVLGSQTNPDPLSAIARLVNGDRDAPIRSRGASPGDSRFVQNQLFASLEKGIILPALARSTNCRLG